MERSQGSSNSRILDLSQFKRTGKTTLLDVREIESAPKEFREFPYKKEQPAIPPMIPAEKDDIIGDLLNEFETELENSTHHQDDRSLHFFTLKRPRVIAEDNSVDEIIKGLNQQLETLQDNCSRVKFLISEIENQLSLED